MSAAPAITVVIPTYNGADYLSEAIESVLGREGDVELLVLDNASVDETPALVARYDDPRLIYHRNAENLGLAGNVGLGCRLARGRALLFLGSDDRLLLGFLAKAVAFLDREPRCTLVHAPAIWIDEAGRRFGGSGHAWRPLTPGARAMLGAFDQGFSFSTMVMRTAAVQAIGELDGSWREVIDLYLFLRMCLCGDVGYLPEAGSEYRVHAAAMSMPMYRDNLMFRRQMTAAAEAFQWPAAVALGAAGQRRGAERAAGRIAMDTLHMARQVGRGRVLRNAGEVLAAVPELAFKPHTWVRLAFALLPMWLVSQLRRFRHARGSALSARPAGDATV